jgi:cell filamentation protein
MSDKISIRFFDNREVRAVWDDVQNKWWFSAVDIIAALTESVNSRKYWSVMKTRFKKE